MTLPSGPIACWNGRWLPAADLHLSVADVGFLQGVTITELLRTFHGRLFETEAHLARLFHSLAVCGISLPESRDELRTLLETLVGHNHPLLPEGSDLAVCLFVTPGLNPQYSPTPVEADRPSLGLHSFEVPFPRWRDAWRDGLRLHTSTVQQPSRLLFDPTIKIRHRLHWYLAEREVHLRDPQSLAVLLDEDGYLTETAVGNLFVLRGEELATPIRTKTLPGISQQYVMQLAAKLGIPCRERDLLPAEALAADELWLTCTTGCIVPVTSFNGSPISSGRPGALFARVIDLWSREVGVDIAGQGQGA